MTGLRSTLGAAKARRLHVALHLIAACAVALAQDPAPPAEKKLEPPQNVALRTPDGVMLQATYFAGPKGKQTPAVILLHGETGTRGSYGDLALRLQAAGCSVLAADLRGFGGSTTTDGGRRLDGSRLAQAEYANMIRYDLEALRRFLIERNNAGELNLSKLGVLAAGMSAPVALNWTYQDWTVPPLSTGKQGQDVHALALVSPAWRSGVVRNEAVLGDAQALRQVALLIAVGDGKPGRALTDAQRLFDALVKVHPGARGGGARGTSDLYLRRYDTTLQGDGLLGGNVGLEDDVVEFFNARLVTPSMDWSARKRAFN